MTDLEMTKLCAEAMGLEPYREHGIAQNSSPWSIFIVDKTQGRGYSHYDPLHEDEQAMALVKKFQLQIQPPWARANRDWRVGDKDNVLSDPHSPDLNRAIVECVAKMQAAKATT